MLVGVSNMAQFRLLAYCRHRWAIIGLLSRCISRHRSGRINPGADLAIFQHRETPSPAGEGSINIYTIDIYGVGNFYLYIRYIMSL